MVVRDEAACKQTIREMLDEQVELLHETIMNCKVEMIPALVDAQLRLLQEMARQ